MIALSLALFGGALAGPVTELVDEVDGDAVVVVRCDRAERVSGPMDAGEGFGFDAVGALADDEALEIDLTAPLHMAVTVVDGAALLTVDVGVNDSERLAARLDDEALHEGLPEGASVARHGERLRLSVPQPGEFAAGSEPIAERADTHAAPGCVLLVDVPGVFAGGPTPLPLLDAARTLEVRFESTTGEHHAILAVDGLDPDVAALLDGVGVTGLPTATSTVRFPVVLQAHGGLREVVRALARTTGGRDALMFAGIAEALPRRVRGEPGLMLTLGPPEVGGALVVPMQRPRTPRRLLRAVERLARDVDAEVERRPDGFLAITPRNRPPVVAGARKGLVVVALRDEVVRDVLAGEGTPWLPPAEAPYGVRLRTQPGMLPFLGRLDGYVEIRYADGAVHLHVQPGDEG